MLKAVIFSALELTSGVAACSDLAERGKGLIIASAAAGWSGLSVFCQIFSISRTKGESISMRFYLSAKIVSSAVCGLITAILIKIFPMLIPSKQIADSTVSLISLYPSTFVMVINIIFIISLFIYFFKNLDRRLNI
jgi:cytochrome bd-type quinol oxidase subunit 2